MKLLLSGSLISLILILLFSVFGNIAHPLLWNDEGETAMYAQRIIRFGYPKVHDEKNILNLTEIPNKSVGVKESIDAWIHLGWAQYYYAVPGVIISNYTGNIYTKTAILRTPFAVIGIIGLVIFALIPLKKIQTKVDKLIFLNLFVLFEITSVFLILHLREVRNYSLNLFLTAATLYIVTSRKWPYLIPILLFLTYNSFFPIYVIFILFLIFSDFPKITKTRVLIITLSVMLAIPLAIFYETFFISQQLSSSFANSPGQYFSNLSNSVIFLSKYDFFYLLLTIKIVTIFVNKGIKFSKLSNSLTLFLITYLLVISKMPYMFERYLVPIQPLITLIILVDTFSLKQNNLDKSEFATILGVVITTFFLILFVKANTLSNHFYELTHPLVGPLDYAILYIKNNFKDTQKLTIATNYEEDVFMYYLGSKVTVGFVGNNLEEDSKTIPDVVIPRKGRPNNTKILANFINQNKYEKITFPIYDYLYNNIPELTLEEGHLFKTKYAEHEEDKLTIYIKK